MTTDPPPDAAPAARRRARLTRTLLRLAVLIPLIGGLYLLCDFVLARANALTPDQAMMKWSMLAALLLAYAILIAAPFVPAVEVGLTMIAMAGAEVAPFVYLATVSGLLLAYGIGRWLPYPAICRILADLRLTGLARMLEISQAMSHEHRLESLRARLPARIGRLALRSRYVLLALLINLPGSTLIGGGGGICLVAGISRLFRPGPTLLTVALAVAPLPLGVWLWWPGLLAV